MAKLDMSNDGFTLTEALVAVVLALMVVAGMLALANPSSRTAFAEPDAVDLQQRLRVGLEAISRDLYTAGSGLDSSLHAGTLGAYLPAIVPRRLGAVGTDAPDVARADVITIIAVSNTSAQSVLSATQSGASVFVDQELSCEPGQPACGLATGKGALIFDGSGRFDIFTILASTGQEVRLRPRASAFSRAYEAGAFVGEVQARTYFLDRTQRQLKQYDTDQTEAPVIDDVVDFTVEYFGTVSRPQFPKPAPGTANCLYDADGQLAPGMLLAAGADGLAPLPLSMFVDGPWCGEGATRFDADLLRIRRVRLTLGAEAPSAARRGAAKTAFVAVDVAPRNMNLQE